MARASGAFALLSSTLLTHTRCVHLRHDPEGTTTLNRWIADDPRVFFFGGIEGSGAKIFQEIWWQYFNDTRYPNDHDKAHHILHFPDGWSCGEAWNESLKTVMTEKLKALQKNEIWSLPYQATYPSCGVHNGQRLDRMHNFHPHLDWLQQAATAADVRLHVIYLQRPLAEALALDCEDRHYDDCLNQADIIVENAKTLKAQIDEMDNDEVSCFQSFADDKMKSDIQARFVDLPSPSRLHDVFESRKLPGDWVEKLGAANQTVAHWSKTMNDLCASMSPFTYNDFHYILERATMEDEHVGTHRKV